MARHHATTPLDDDTDATLGPDPLLTDIEGLNRCHVFVMNGGKAMVMNFGRNQKRGETLIFSAQTDFNLGTSGASIAAMPNAMQRCVQAWLPIGKADAKRLAQPVDSQAKQA
jgi:hypothetical protein